MAKILLYWGWDADLIECSQVIADNLSKYQYDFDDWISNEKNEHGYWTRDGEGGKALNFTGDAFLNWLNNIILKDKNDKAKFLKREFVPNKDEMKLPRINF